MQAFENLLIHQAGTLPPMLAALAVVAGVIVLLLGWRLSGLVATLNFSLFGILVGGSLTVGTDWQWAAAGIGAVAFGAMAMWLEYYGEVVSGGLIAGLGAVVLMGWICSPLPATLLATAVAFACVVALSWVAYRQTSAVLTAVQGGLLTAFGLAACMYQSGPFWHDIRSVLAHSSVAQIMFLLAPIAIGVTFQLASIQNEEVLAR